MGLCLCIIVKRWSLKKQLKAGGYDAENDNVRVCVGIKWRLFISFGDVWLQNGAKLSIKFY